MEFKIFCQYSYFVETISRTRNQPHREPYISTSQLHLPVRNAPNWQTYFETPLSQINILVFRFENKSIHVPLLKRYRLQVILKKHCLENIRVYAVVTQNSKVPNAYIAVVYDHLLMALESLCCTGGLHYYIAAPTEEKYYFSIKLDACCKGLSNVRLYNAFTDQNASLGFL